MTYDRKSPRRTVVAALTTTVVLVIGMLALAPAASARVIILPGTAQGGGTETFAVRLANEKPGTSATRLELTFPTDLAVPHVEAAPADGWTSQITMRPLAAPLTVGDDVVDEAVDSVVWEGGRVAPNRFEQFLLTAGPLPPDGLLVFTVTQSYSDGSVERWSDAAAPGQRTAGAPTVALVPQAADVPEVQPVHSGDVTEGELPAVVAAPAEVKTPVPWALVGGGGLLLVAAATRWYLRSRRHRPEAAAERDDPTIELPHVPPAIDFDDATAELPLVRAGRR